MRILLIHLLLVFALLAQAQRPNNNSNNNPNNNPNHQNYHCPQAMSAADFDQAMSYIKKESFDDNKILVAKRVVDGNYLLASQAKEITKQFSFATAQLDFAKYAYAKTYDQKNYYIVSDVFSFPSDKKKLNEWLGGQPINDYSRNPRDNYPVAMSNEDFNLAIKQIKKESFDDNKILVAKRVVDGNYLLSSQAKEITKQFSFATAQLDFAKYAYAKTFDQKNYYIVNDVFSFSSDKRALSEWLAGQPINNYQEDYDHHHNNGNHHSPNNPNGNNGGNNNNNNNNNGLNNNPNGNNNNNPNGNNGGNNNNNNNNGLNNNPNGNNNTAAVAMAEGVFLDVKAQFSAKPSDRIKVQYAEHLMAQNYWSVQQISELMQLLRFEDERLNLAKAAYAKTVDNQSYGQLMILLSDNNNKQALQQFIDQQGANGGIRR